MNDEILAQLRDRLHYNPTTGIFTWKKTPKHGSVKAGDCAGNVNKGYLRIDVNGRSILAHRIAWYFVTGEWPTQDIDHINRNRSDNRFENLRHVSRSANAFNGKLNKLNSSGLKGISFDKSADRWKAYIGDAIYLGSSKDFFEACCLRKSAENVSGNLH